MENGVKKGLKHYWEFIETPVFVLIIWAFIGLVFPIKDYVPTLIYSIISWVITILVFGYLGYVVVKEKSNTPGDCAKAGAYTGAIVGLAGAVLAITFFYISPGIFDSTLQQMINAGLDAQSANTYLQIGLFSGIITGPLISAIVGALVSWISGLIFRKKK